VLWCIRSRDVAGFDLDDVASSIWKTASPARLARRRRGWWAPVRPWPSTPCATTSVASASVYAETPDFAPHQVADSWLRDSQQLRRFGLSEFQRVEAIPQFKALSQGLAVFAGCLNLTSVVSIPSRRT
jgi:hypothetical protein